MKIGIRLPARAFQSIWSTEVSSPVSGSSIYPNAFCICGLRPSGMPIPPAPPAKHSEFLVFLFSYMVSFVSVALLLPLIPSLHLPMCLSICFSCLLSLPVCLSLKLKLCKTHFWGASEIQGTFVTVMREIGAGPATKNVSGQVSC